MGSPETSKDDLTRAEKILVHVPERVVLATISVLTLLAYGLNDFIFDWLPDSWLITGLYVAVFALILVLLAVPPARLRALTKRKHPDQELDLSALTPPDEPGHG